MKLELWQVVNREVGGGKNEQAYLRRYFELPFAPFHGLVLNIAPYADIDQKLPQNGDSPWWMEWVVNDGYGAMRVVLEDIDFGEDKEAEYLIALEAFWETGWTRHSCIDGDATVDVIAG